MDYSKINLKTRKKHRILALGAQSKSSFCFSKGGVLFLSQLGGDLGNLNDLKAFEKDVKKIKIRPEIVVCDLHPDYASTRLANDMFKDSGSRLIGIQHHEAHIASNILDNDIKGSVIGIAFDGTGFGTDGNIWGGEFFVGSTGKMKRAAYLKYLPMPGAEASIARPWQMAASYLYDIYAEKIKDLGIGLIKKLDKQDLDLLIQIIDKRINSPLTSSIGRLFDAVSAMIGIRHEVEYEGQAAIELEKELHDGDAISGDRYHFKYKRDNVVIIDWAPVIKGIVSDLQSKKSRGEISSKFHSAVCGMIKDVCIILRKKYSIDKVCMSGGVFQNRYLTANIRPLLEEEDFKVYLHRNLSAHDGNIAVGQAAIAARM